ncbi:hypothetical protein BRC60_04755 [Halobacteriales archaeon QH_1_68_42]|nr:MAG: hypothetical protein BRC60_04755 [Halobacteriales archaeon QH_1_68_42]
MTRVRDDADATDAAADESAPDEAADEETRIRDVPDLRGADAEELETLRTVVEETDEDDAEAQYETTKVEEDR